MDELLKECRLCPRNCGINRLEKVGVCGAGKKMKIAYYSLHEWEEPVISGDKGSGTIFFSHCNLKCIFCQNKRISTLGYGKEVTGKRFREICLELQSRGAHNINLVTPTHYVPQIAKELKKLKDKELKIPVVYNTSSYENVDTIKFMDGLVDIYLADLKYYDNELGEKYSNCKDYFKYATQAIDEMFHQVGECKFKDDLITRGLIVRILILPGHADDACKLVEYLYNTYGDKIWISLMNQFTPCNVSFQYDNLNREITDDEYNMVIHYACDLGVDNAFVQMGGTADESFIPKFDCDIV